MCVIVAFIFVVSYVTLSIMFKSIESYLFSLRLLDLIITLHYCYFYIVGVMFRLHIIAYALAFCWIFLAITWNIYRRVYIWLNAHLMVWHSNNSHFICVALHFSTLDFCFRILYLFSFICDDHTYALVICNSICVVIQRSNFVTFKVNLNSRFCSFISRVSSCYMS